MEPPLSTPPPARAALVARVAWRAAYVNPSARRNRRMGATARTPKSAAHYLSVRCSLKPRAGPHSDIYLQKYRQRSVLTRRRHDIRFVEDDWERPYAGGLGLGWEVGATGMEITHSRIPAGRGIRLRSGSVELTYGLERLAIMCVASSLSMTATTNTFDMARFPPAEREFSAFDFEQADVDILARAF